jgi:hypothetical protein
MAYNTEQSPVFDRLKAGTYTITILDENGCETTTSLLNLATPGPLDVTFPTDLTCGIERYRSADSHLLPAAGST